MKLKNSQIQILHTVLSRLEPLEGKCAKCGEPVAQPKPFNFSGKVRYNIAKNLKLLGSALEDLEALRMKLVRERLKGEEKELTGEAKADFLRVYGEVLEVEVEIPLHVVTVTELDLGANPIPLLLLEHLLGKIIIEDKP